MNEQARQEELNFKVECSWCGKIIRRNNVKDSHGMCLKCYARMLGDYGHIYETGNTLRWGKRDERE